MGKKVKITVTILIISLVALGAFSVSVLTASTDNQAGVSEGGKAEYFVGVETDSVLNELVAKLEMAGVVVSDYGITHRPEVRSSGDSDVVYQLAMSTSVGGPLARHLVHRTASLMKAEGKQIPAVEILLFDNASKFAGGMTSVPSDELDASVRHPVLTLEEARTMLVQSVAVSLDTPPVEGSEEAWWAVQDKLKMVCDVTESADGTRTANVSATFSSDVTDDQMSMVGLAVEPVVRTLNERHGAGFAVEAITFTRGTEVVLEEIRDLQFGQTSGKTWSSYTPAWHHMPYIESDQTEQ